MGHPELTKLQEKEKAALRLLIRGYDAKSAARHIGVTPNVINERLRSARQKLSVTSSKEAARLLAENEDIAPNFFVPKEIGIVPTPKNTAINPLPDKQVAMSDDNSVREMQATYETYSSFPKPLSSVPFRKQGELGNDLGKTTRLKAIGDLTVKLAATFAFICLAAMLVSTLISRT